MFHLFSILLIFEIYIGVNCLNFISYKLDINKLHQIFVYSHKNKCQLYIFCLNIR